MPELRVAWLFPGQGSQEVGMGRDLFDGSPAARRVFETADSVLDIPVTKLCFEGSAEELQDTENTQPALFTASAACLEAARESGALTPEVPAFVAGHSMGEYVAYVAAGAISLEDGLRLVRERGRLMQRAAEANPGAMAAIIGLDEEQVTTICTEAGAEVCNFNAPGQIVIGGTEEGVDAAMALALERGAQRGIRLKVSGAFHTSRMNPASEGMARALDAVALHDAAIPVVANTTGEPISDRADLREELVQQVMRPVQWVRTIQFLKAQGITAVIEFGPSRVLTGLVRRTDRSIAVRNISDLKSARSPATPSPTPP